MNTKFRDAYGQRATIREDKGRYRLQVNEPGGRHSHSGDYATFRAAKSALVLYGYCWTEYRSA